MKKVFTYGILILLTCAFSACFPDDQNVSEIEEYTGPDSESENVVIRFTEATVIKVIMKGRRQLLHQNGDIEFPDGLEVTFYDENGEKTSILTALTGFKSADENIYRANGDVVVRNLSKEETLRTEELFWNPDTQKIYTNKFVTVQTPTELIQAEGLVAPQDFSSYEFTKPRDGEIKLDDN